MEIENRTQFSFSTVKKKKKKKKKKDCEILVILSGNMKNVPGQTFNITT